MLDFALQSPLLFFIVIYSSNRKVVRVVILHYF
jgi:hypothetical protein